MRGNLLLATICHVAAALEGEPADSSAATWGRALLRGVWIRGTHLSGGRTRLAT